MTQDEMKQAVGQAAVERLLPHLDANSIVGVGTGSTANCFIDALAKHKLAFDGAVASSEATAERLKSHGITVYDLNGVPQLDFYVDGADESNENLELIKGGGAALTREKIVAAVADTFICIADESKLVPVLGNFPLPVEVIPMARSHVAREIAHFGTVGCREGWLSHLHHTHCLSVEVGEISEALRWTKNTRHRTTADGYANPFCVQALRHSHLAGASDS